MSHRPDPEALRDFFLGWQCRIRQISVRQQGGQPMQAIRPKVTTVRGEPLMEAVTLLLVPLEPEESTAFFRFQVQKTPDPRQVYEQALAYLAGDYYQRPEAFSDEMTALFGQEDAVAPISAPGCELACCRFRRHRVRCFDGTGGVSWRDGSLRENSSLRLLG